MSKGFFISGTGTGVGKTFTTCALIHAARARAVKVSARKPVLTGNAEHMNDAVQLREALGAPDLSAITRWQFDAPLAPYRAAALEHETIPFDELVAWSRQGEGVKLVEGVGGIMVPLTAQHTVLDWMKALDWPVIVVTGSYLGAISHTLSALHVLRTENITPAALVINETQQPGVGLQETLAGLAPFMPESLPVVLQPHVATPADATDIHTLVELWTSND